MRNFTNTLLFETALDSISNSNPGLKGIADRLFSPTVKVVEADCDTQLGVIAALAERTEGSIELDTDTPITRAMLIAASNAGNTGITIRTLASCISDGGVCRKCLLASRPRLTSTSVGDMVKVYPELTVDAESVSVPAGTTSVSLSHLASEYDVLYVFDDGALVPTSSYSISGNVLTLNSAPTVNKVFLVKYEVASHIAFFYWLARTYSSSLLGVRSMFNLPLPVKASLLRSMVVDFDIEDLYKALLASEVAAEDFVTYIPSIKDPLEKAVYVILLASVFLNS